MGTKAENLTFLSSPGGTSDTPAIYIAVTTTHAAIAVPASLIGRFVKIANESGTTTDFVDFFFSFSPTAEVDRNVASSASGATSPKLGERLYGGLVTQGRVPYLGGGKTSLYLIIEGSAAINIRISLAEQ